MSMAQEKAEFLKGTLDMLILKVVAAGPIHVYSTKLAARARSSSRLSFSFEGSNSNVLV